MDDSLKHEVQLSLVKLMLRDLEANKTDLATMKKAANFILDHVEKIKDYSQLTVFLEELQKEWPLFQEVYTIYKNKLNEDKEQLVMSKLSNYIKTTKTN